MRRAIWVVVPVWDARSSHYYADHPTKNGAIKAFVRDVWDHSKTWKQLHREGWRCVRATVTWRKP